MSNADYQITGLYTLRLVGVKTGVEQRVDLILDQGLEGYSAVLMKIGKHTIRVKGERAI